MLHMIVIGATGLKCPPDVAETIQGALNERWPEWVHYAEDRETAFKMLDEWPDAVIAYAPGVFGDAACGAQISPKINTVEAQIIITTLGNPDELHGTDDPRQFLTAAHSILKVSFIVAADSPVGMDMLHLALNPPALDDGRHSLKEAAL